MNIELKTNFNAAELLGYIPFESVVKDEAVKIGKANDERYFDIFANTPQGAYDLLQVADTLAEKHGVNIGYRKTEDPAKGGWAKEPEFWWFDSETVWGKGFKKRTEAIAAAVNAVKGE